MAVVQPNRPAVLVVSAFVTGPLTIFAPCTANFSSPAGVNGVGGQTFSTIFRFPPRRTRGDRSPSAALLAPLENLFPPFFRRGGTCRNDRVSHHVSINVSARILEARVRFELFRAGKSTDTRGRETNRKFSANRVPMEG